jgi:hypothetical protein
MKIWRITSDAPLGDRVLGLSDTEVFLWPEDDDRLTMAFLTGA